MHYKYDLKRLARYFLRKTRDRFAPTDGVPRYAVKWKTLSEFFSDNSPVIETGTYLGETTAFLATKYISVKSFEPYAPLASYNTNRFKQNTSVTIINKTSEDGLHQAMSDHQGVINFWLDGHFSGQGTFGDIENASPILLELNAIFSWEKVSPDNRAFIAVDDARLFTGKNGYPTILEIAKICDQHGYGLSVFNDIILISQNDRREALIRA